MPSGTVMCQHCTQGVFRSQSLSTWRTVPLGASALSSVRAVPEQCRGSLRLVTQQAHEPGLNLLSSWSVYPDEMIYDDVENGNEGGNSSPEYGWSSSEFESYEEPSDSEGKNGIPRSFLRSSHKKQVCAWSVWRTSVLRLTWEQVWEVCFESHTSVASSQTIQM